MVQFPADYLKAVVALGLFSPEGQVEWTPHGTGFLYGRTMKSIGEYSCTDSYLVTNFHIFHDKQLERDYPDMFACIQRTEAKSGLGLKLTLLDKSGERLWSGSEESDTAVIRVPRTELEKAGASLFVLTEEAHAYRITENECSEGDSIVAVGFPLRIPSSNTNCPILRTGVIARVRDLYAKKKDHFLIDCMLDQGNSGGPVFLKPSPFHAPGTAGADEIRVAGIVTARLSCTRSGIEESLSLAKVTPVEAIDILIEEHINKFGPIKCGPLQI